MVSSPNPYRLSRGVVPSAYRLFLTPDLDPLGRQIIQACLDDATQEDYWKLIPHIIFKEF